LVGFEYIKNNLDALRSEIKELSAKYGNEVTLVCVTKSGSDEELCALAEYGASDIGENRPQELRDKYDEVSGACWHLIGHLQTNKVKYVTGKASLIHSVESLHLAQAIDEEAKKQGIVQDILLEVNISGEESKYGLTTDEIPTIIKEIETLSNIRFKGFMTMAPLMASEDEIRSIFRTAKQLFDSYKEKGATELSMGMSGDFEVAIEEGATFVRVGTALFGVRKAKKWAPQSTGLTTDEFSRSLDTDDFV
jgi:pyridoxal phosphate enzyme (YggS family)